MLFSVSSTAIIRRIQRHRRRSSHHSHRFGAVKLPLCRRLPLALKETVPVADAESTWAMCRLSGYMIWEHEQCQPL